MKRSGAIGNKVAVTRRHIGEYDANRRLDSHDIRKITKDLILVNNEVSTKFGGVAQLGEHLPCKQGVRSSILLISTNLFERRGWGRQKRDADRLHGLIAQVVRAHA